MIYQFMDWRIGWTRRLCMIEDVDRLFKRLREANGYVLPTYLAHWDHLIIFAGECAIMLPENQRVAENLDGGNDAYPSLKWLREQYEKFIQWMSNNPEYADKLVDPPLPKAAPKLVEPPTPVKSPDPKGFDTLVEGSVSNTGDQQCLEPNPAIVSPTGTLTGSPNSLSMGKKPQPTPSRR